MLTELLEMVHYKGHVILVPCVKPTGNAKVNVTHL